MDEEFDQYTKFDSLIESLKYEHRFIIKPENKKFLDELIDFGVNHCAITIEQGKKLYRSRKHPPYGIDYPYYFYDPKDMGAPPKNLCKYGRLNPDGIPYLYCSFEEETAIYEQRPHLGLKMTVVDIIVKTNLTIIDTSFANYSSKNSHELRCLTWMHLINDLFSTPVAYVPTQYIAELFKNHMFHGIKYKSAMNKGGNNLVIFDPKLVKIRNPRRIAVFNMGKIKYAMFKGGLPTYSDPSVTFDIILTENKDFIEIKDTRLQFMENVLKCLQQNYADYSDKFANDSLYWYNERANIGTFAGAIWKCGGMALEEYGDKKTDESSTWKGRVDLFFTIEDKNVLSEAKMIWIKYPFESISKVRKRIESKLKSACDETKISNREKNHIGLGLLFVVPYWENGSEFAKIEQIIAVIKNTNSGFSMGYINNTKDIISSNNNVCNSVFVIGKIAE